MATEAIPAAVLVVDGSHDAEPLLVAATPADAGLVLLRVDDARAAVARLESGDLPDVVVLGPRLADPVRVAQRIHSLDRDGAIVILAEPDRVAEVARALEVAPFLGGDIECVSSAGSGMAALLSEAAGRTRARRAVRAERVRGRETPPPLSARYLGTLLDSAPIGIVTIDAGGCVIGWNRRAGEMLSVPEVEALGSRFAELWPEDARERMDALVASLGSGGLDAPGEAFERAGKSFEINGARFAIRSGESGAILVLQDITQRAAAERALRFQKALLEAQAESAEAGIVVVAPDGRVEILNRRFAEIWGLPDAAVADPRGRLTELMLEEVEDRDAFMAPRALLEADPAGQHRDEIRLRDGRTIERYSTVARTPDGEIVGRVWFHTDISARKRDEEALRFLTEASDLLYASLDYETTLRRVADLAVASVADWCGVEVLADGGRRQLAVAHTDPAKVALARELQQRYAPEEREYDIVPQILSTGEPVLIAEVSDELLVQGARDEEHLRLLRALGLHSLMVVPMRSRGRVLGLITFASSESGHVFDQDDLELAQELARRAAIAIDNARVHAELRHTAHTLQDSLLPPHLPAILGVELAARFRPARTGLDVGGDFYDIFEVGPEQWALAVGDVCGKGAQAAALTALTRYTARAAAMYEGSPAGVLRVLNEALMRQRNEFRFTTLAFCVLDLSGAVPKLIVASAGHPPPLVLRADGEAIAVAARGSLLGVLADVHFDEVELELGRGDLVVLYTDGLTDALAPEHLITEDDLLAELRACRGRSAAEAIGRLEDLALASTEEPRDDVALVALRLTP
jgi:PAS domain S-box-containing protein